MQTNLLDEKIKSEKLRQVILYDRIRPATLYRSFLYFDGEQWVCVAGFEDEQIAKEMFGEDVHSRVYGYGASPDKAMQDFDRAWKTGDFEVRL